jgi:hypothetical protein
MRALGHDEATKIFVWRSWIRGEDTKIREELDLLRVCVKKGQADFLSRIAETQALFAAEVTKTDEGRESALIS